MNACPVLCVGHAVRSRLFAEARVWIARAGAPWRPWPAEYGQGTRLINSLVRPGSWGTPDAIRAERPGAVRRAAGQHDWARACEGRQRALQKEADHARGRSWDGFSPQVQDIGSPRLSLGPAPDGRSAPPPHPGPRPEPWGKPGAALLSRRIADRAYDGEAFRAWLAQRGLQAFIPARARRRDPPPYDLGQYFVTFQLGTSF